DSDVPLRTNLVTGEMVCSLLPPLEAETHKGARGTVLVVAGSIGFTGAAVLTCNAALRSGAGLVFLACPRSLNAIYEVKLTEAITRPVPDGDDEGRFGVQSVDQIAAELHRADALALGPGLSTAECVCAMMAELLRRVQVPTVMDADALNILANRRDLVLPRDCVLTPHPGEMGRLMGLTPREVQEQRLDTARSAAKAFGRIVVLKGGATVVSDPSGEVFVNPTGNSGMATGGTGDVLTGAIAALMARGLKPLDAAVAGVYIHGLAGDLTAEELGREGMVAGDLLPRLPLAFRRVREEAT
ncbi:MAG: NAD(P)H-hydrate dehydratase, partial [Armatimonadota bacterium]